MGKTRGERWTVSQARRELARCESSGLTIADYSRKRGLSAKRLYRWRKRLGEQTRRDLAVGVDVQTQWVEATVTQTAGSEPAVAISNGWDMRLEVHAPDRVTTGWLATLWQRLSSGQ
jgi:hypothetical protein